MPLKHLMILFFIVKSTMSFASHAMGGQITYECLGTNLYKIKLELVRDCSGIPLSSSQSVVVTNSCGLSNPVLTLNQNGAPQQYAFTCAPGLNTCNGGSTFGFEKYTFEDTLTLPGSCNNWTFSKTLNGRNSSITTTVQGANDSLYIYSILNNSNSICNNSPIFYNVATTFGLIGYASCYGQGAYDIDGDSLVFELVHPRTGPSIADTVQYLAGYSFTEPIHSSPVITFDSGIGSLCYTGTQIENSVFATLVSEFRNGVLIGQVERDIQLRMMMDPVTNITPTLTGINGTNQVNLAACPGVPIEFYIACYDSNLTENVTLYWNQGIPAASWNNPAGTASNSDTAFFSWTPSIADVSPTPYCFTVNVHDNHCPYTGQASKTFCIVVYPTGNPICINPGIQENYPDDDVTLYPNPAHSSIELKMRENFIQGAEWVFYNVLGEELLRVSSAKNNIIKLDVSSWHRGVYEAILNSKNRTIHKRFIIR